MNKKEKPIDKMDSRLWCLPSKPYHAKDRTADHRIVHPYALEVQESDTLAGHMMYTCPVCKVYFWDQINKKVKQDYYPGTEWQ